MLSAREWGVKDGEATAAGDSPVVVARVSDSQRVRTPILTGCSPECVSGRIDRTVLQYTFPFGSRLAASPSCLNSQNGSGRRGESSKKSYFFGTETPRRPLRQPIPGSGPVSVIARNPLLTIALCPGHNAPAHSVEGSLRPSRPAQFGALGPARSHSDCLKPEAWCDRSPHSDLSRFPNNGWPQGLVEQVPRYGRCVDFNPHEVTTPARALPRRDAGGYRVEQVPHYGRSVDFNPHEATTQARALPRADARGLHVQQVPPDGRSVDFNPHEKAE
jgi:hypothetical protein